MRQRAVKVVLTLVLACCVVAFAVNKGFYDSSIISIFFALALASTLILHLRVRPRGMDALLVLACTIFFIALDFRILHFQPSLVGCLSFFGLSSLLVLGGQTVWAKGEERKLLLFAWIPAVLFVTSEWFASSLLDWTTSAHPKTLDLFLFSFDASLHVQLSFLLGQLFHARAWLANTALIFYIGLPAIIALIYAEQLVRRKEKAWPVAVAFLITGPLGVLFYNWFPAVGPVHVFKSWPNPPLRPDEVSRLLLEPISAQGPRNAMPSLHMAWVLLAWWYSRGASWWARTIAMAFLVFTVLATMGTGEHYFADLVVAFPFALLIRAIFAFSLPWSNKERIGAACFGAVATFAWLVLLRLAMHFFWVSPLVPWAFVFATLAVTIAAKHMLEESEDRGVVVAAVPEPILGPEAEEVPST